MVTVVAILVAVALLNERALRSVASRWGLAVPPPSLAVVVLAAGAVLALVGWRAGVGAAVAVAPLVGLLVLVEVRALRSSAR